MYIRFPFKMNKDNIHISSYIVRVYSSYTHAHTHTHTLVKPCLEIWMSTCVNHFNAHVLRKRHLKMGFTRDYNRENGDNPLEFGVHHFQTNPSS